MPEKANQRVATIKSLSHSDRADLLILINSLIDGIRAVTLILDADAGVTATNLTASFDAQVTKT